MFCGRFNEFAFAERIEGFIFYGALPTQLRDPRFQQDDLFHDLLPGAAGQGWVAVLQIDLSDLEIHRRLAHGLVFRLDQFAGLCLGGVL